MQPMSMSGFVSMRSNCFMASWPIMVWCMQTWFSTEPSVYLAFSSVRTVFYCFADGNAQANRYDWGLL